MNFLTYLKLHGSDILLEAFANYFGNDEYFNLDIIGVSIEDKENTKFKFYANTLVEYEVGIEKDKEERNKYLVVGEGNLCEPGLGIKVVEIEKEGSYKIKSNKKMTPSFLPIINNNEIDDEATAFLKEYYPEALLGEPINTDILVSRMGLKLERHRLSLDDSVFGLISFKNGKIKCYDNSKEEYINVNEGTIIIDNKCSCNYAGNNTDNFTIVHECIHWYKHRKYFLFRKSQEVYLSCENDFVNDQDIFYLEYHANKIASSVLMYPKTIKKIIDMSKEEDFIEKMKNVIDTVSSIFGVSRMAVKTKLLDMGYKIKGIYDYIDKKYIKSYAYSKDIDKDETFSVTIRELLLSSYTNDKVNDLLKSNRYVYVDNHICIKDSKYVYFDIFLKEYNLTNYALNHIDECCLLFNIKSNKSLNSEYLSHSYTICRSKSKKEIMKIEEFKAPSIIIGQPDLLKKELEKANILLKRIEGKTIGGALEQCRLSMGYSRQALSDAALYSDKTIRDIETKKGRTVKMENILRIALGLHLPPIITERLLEIGNYSLDNINSELNKIFTFIIYYRYNCSYYQINKILEENGFEPLFIDKMQDENRNC